MESKFKFKCPTSAEISASFLFKPKSDILDKVLVYYAFVTQTGSNMSQVCLVIWFYLFSPIIRKEEQDCTRNNILLKKWVFKRGFTNHKSSQMNSNYIPGSQFLFHAAKTYLELRNNQLKQHNKELSSEVKVGLDLIIFTPFRSRKMNECWFRFSLQWMIRCGTNDFSFLSNEN